MSDDRTPPDQLRVGDLILVEQWSDGSWRPCTSRADQQHRGMWARIVALGPGPEWSATVVHDLHLSLRDGAVRWEATTPSRLINGRAVQDAAEGGVHHHDDPAGPCRKGLVHDGDCIH